MKELYTTTAGEGRRALRRPKKAMRRALGTLLGAVLAAVLVLPLPARATSGVLNTGGGAELEYTVSGSVEQVEEATIEGGPMMGRDVSGTCHSGLVRVEGTFTLLEGSDWVVEDVCSEIVAYTYGEGSGEKTELLPAQTIVGQNNTVSFDVEVPVRDEDRDIQVLVRCFGRGSMGQPLLGAAPSADLNVALQNLDFGGAAALPPEEPEPLPEEGGYEDYYEDEDYEEEYEDYEDYEDDYTEYEDTGIGPEETYVEAEDTPGEQGIGVPAVIGAAMAGGALLIGGKLLRKKKPQKEKKQKKTEKKRRRRDEKPARRPEPQPEQKQPEEPEEEKPKPTYQMRVYKTFGDTFYPGDQYPVYARMVEISPDGQEKMAPDLTQKIRISTKGYLKAGPATMAGDYQGAYVSAPASGPVPETAVVVFDFARIYKVEMQFKVCRQEVLFGQENLTLPALQGEEADLPFVVLGAGPECTVEVSLSQPLFEVTLRTTRDPKLYVAHIRERAKHSEEPGTSELCTMTVTVTDQRRDGVRTFKGELPLFRFHMGLAVKLDFINCFAVLKEDAQAKPRAELTPDDYAPALTVGHMILYDWDRETHRLLRIAPLLDSAAFAATGSEQQRLTDALGIRCIATDQVDEEGRRLNLWCEQATLDPPTRFSLDMTLTASVGDKHVTGCKRVMAHSQPMRDYKLDRDLAARCKQVDGHITERLKHMQKYIRDRGAEKQFFPLMKFIDMMLKGYSPLYGYDPEQVERVRDAFGRFVSGESVGMGADPAQPLTLGDELCMAMQAFVDTTVEFDKQLGFFSRVALGVVVGSTTMSLYNHVANVATVAKIMQTADSVEEAWVMGSTIYVADYAIEKAAKAITDAAVRFRGSAAKVQARPAVPAAKPTKPGSFVSGQVGQQSARAIRDNAAAAAAAQNSAAAAVQAGRKTLQMNAQQQALRALEKQTEAFSKQKVVNFGGAEAYFRMNNNAAARELYREAFDAVNADPLARTFIRGLPSSSPVKQAFYQTGRHYFKDVGLAREALAESRSIQLLIAAGSKRPLAEVVQNTLDNKLYTEDLYRRIAKRSDQSAKAFLDAPVSTGAEMAQAVHELGYLAGDAMKSAFNAAGNALQQDYAQAAELCQQQRIQLVAQHFDRTEGANVHRMSLALPSAVPDQMRQGAALCGMALADSEDMLTPSELEALLQKSGYTLDSLADAVGAVCDSL